MMTGRCCARKLSASSSRPEQVWRLVSTRIGALMRVAAGLVQNLSRWVAAFDGVLQVDGFLAQQVPADQRDGLRRPAVPHAGR